MKWPLSLYIGGINCNRSNNLKRGSSSTYKVSIFHSNDTLENYNPSFEINEFRNVHFIDLSAISSKIDVNFQFHYEDEVNAWLEIEKLLLLQHSTLYSNDDEINHGIVKTGGDLQDTINRIFELITYTYNLVKNNDGMKMNSTSLPRSYITTIQYQRRHNSDNEDNLTNDNIVDNANVTAFSECIQDAYDAKILRSDSSSSSQFPNPNACKVRIDVIEHKDPRLKKDVQAAMPWAYAQVLRRTAALGSKIHALEGGTIKTNLSDSIPSLLLPYNQSNSVNYNGDNNNTCNNNNEIVAVDEDEDKLEDLRDAIGDSLQAMRTARAVELMVRVISIPRDNENDRIICLTSGQDIIPEVSTTTKDREKNIDVTNFIPRLDKYDRQSIVLEGSGVPAELALSANSKRKSRLASLLVQSDETKAQMTVNRDGNGNDYLFPMKKLERSKIANFDVPRGIMELQPIKRLKKRVDNRFGEEKSFQDVTFDGATATRLGLDIDLQGVHSALRDRGRCGHINIDPYSILGHVQWQGEPSESLKREVRRRGNDRLREIITNSKESDNNQNITTNPNLKFIEGAFTESAVSAIAIIVEELLQRRINLWKHHGRSALLQADLSARTMQIESLAQMMDATGYPSTELKKAMKVLFNQ